jgi:hypothetical protein
MTTPLDYLFISAPTVRTFFPAFATRSRRLSYFTLFLGFGRDAFDQPHYQHDGWDQLSDYYHCEETEENPDKNSIVTCGGIFGCTYSSGSYYSYQGG